MALWSGKQHRLDAVSRRAERLTAGRLVHGRTARSLFPERPFRTALAAMDEARESGEPVIIRQRLWAPIRRLGLPKEVKVVARPYFEDDDAARAIGVISEVHTACDDPRCDALDSCCEERAVDRRSGAVPSWLTYGAVSFYQTKVNGLDPESAVALVELRQAARDAFVEAAGPLVDEMRRLRRGVPSSLGSHLQSQQRRPS
jgi:hypothetical protein